MSIKQFLKDWTLPVAIATGTVVYLIFYWVPQLEPASNFFGPIIDTIFPMMVAVAGAMTSSEAFCARSM